MEDRYVMIRCAKPANRRLDFRDFHEEVLRNGTLPLDLLEEQVEAYIASAGR